MTALTHDEVCSALEQLANFYVTEGFSVSPFGGGPRISTWVFTGPGVFSVIKAVAATDMPLTFIEVAGGGAKGIRPDGAIFRHLLIRHRDFDWGSPFVCEWPDGTVTIGSRLLLSSELMGRDGLGRAVGFVGRMVRALGTSARTMATEIVPHLGGEILDGSDPQHAAHLFSALA